MKRGYHATKPLLPKPVLNYTHCQWTLNWLSFVASVFITSIIPPIRIPPIGPNSLCSLDFLINK